MAINYLQALDYMYTHLPMFQRIGSAAYKANLDNTWAICNLLNAYILQELMAKVLLVTC
jgi:hypothetical protein